MNKKKIDEYIPKAYNALKDSSLVKDGEMPKTYRGYISSFGAAIIMGSVRAAVAYQQKDPNRKALMDVIFEVLKSDINSADKKYNDLFDYVSKADNREAEENIYNAAIAVKLAMNQFELTKEKSGGEKNEQ